MRSRKADLDDETPLPIDVQCACGRNSVAPDQHAGKKARCPACGAVMVVPGVTVAGPMDVVEHDASTPELDDDLVASLKRRATPLPGPVPDPPGFRRYEDPPTPSPVDPSIQKVFLVNMDVPFESMCWFILKWSLATIPTLLVFGMIGFLIYLFIAAQR